MNNKVVNSFFWKFLERFGTNIVQLIIQIILARLLAPEYYGSLSIMLIFINIFNVLIHNGFNQSLLQKKEVTEEDYSSVFWLTFISSVLIYLLLYFTIPFISNFYNSPELVRPFRILSLNLIIGSYQAIPLIKLTKALNFKAIFINSIGAIIISGLLGIYAAYCGYGLWALVIQSLTSSIIITIILAILVRWIPTIKMNLNSTRNLFSYGWKILIASLMDSVYQDLRSLIIGKKYDNATLAYYKKGKTFPNTTMTAVNATLQAIMLPIISNVQDDKKKVKELTRNSMMVSEYFVLPAMAGLAAIATPLILILLTDKWIDSVIYLQIYCIIFAFYPFHTCNLQAISAIGRSDIFLKLEIIKKSIGIISILIAVFCFHSPIAIALTGAITALFSTFINAYPNKKLIGYSYWEQLKDIFPSLFMSLIMFLAVLGLGTLAINIYLLVVIQIFSGILIYVLLSVILKPLPYKLIIAEVKKFLAEKNKKRKVQE